MRHPFLSSKRLEFYPLDASFLSERYISWLNDEEVCRYNRHHIYPYTLEQAQNYIQNVTQNASEIVLAIVEKASRLHIGNVALQKIDLINRNADISILIGDKSSWGNAYAAEAMRTLMAHGFEQLNLHRIYCGTSSDNQAMQKVAKNLGMKEEGRRREVILRHSVYYDQIDYGILKEEFNLLKMSPHDQQ